MTSVDELYNAVEYWQKQKQHLLQVAYEYKFLKLAKQIIKEDRELLLKLRDM